MKFLGRMHGKFMNESDSWTEMELVAHRHLEKLANGRWRSTGNDPGFKCTLGAPTLKAGWYEVEIGIEHLAGPELCPFLYPDYGDHNHEAHRTYLPFLKKGHGVHRGLALFKRDARALRFDPAVSPCEFSVGAFRLRRIGRAAAARQMLAWIRNTSVSPARDVARLGLGLLRGGARGFGDQLYAIYAREPDVSFTAPYKVWLDLYDDHGAAAVAGRALAAQLDGPKISVVLPVYNAPEKWLTKAIDSVVGQSYGNWELCIANDASTAPHVRRVLDRYGRDDARIKVIHRPVNGHISASSNSALELATGEWIALLDHDDELHPMALLEVAEAIRSNPQWRIIYSDEDKIDEKGRRFDPYMKSDWNYDLFLSHNCVSHLGVYHAPLIREIGGFTLGMEGSQDWDLALRAIERLGGDQIGHIPKVLYHWRAIQGSTALAPQEKDYAHDAGIRAIQAHLDRSGTGGRVESIPGLRGNYRVRYALPSPVPKVTIIIPTRDGVELLRACIESIHALTTYPDYEILVVDNQSSDRASLAYLAQLDEAGRARVIPYDAPFNYSRINNHAVAQASGSVMCFLNNDITVISPDWLQEMVGHACRPTTGAVGAMLYYPNDTIQHAGVVVGVHGVAAHAFSGRGRGDPGHMGRGRLAQTLSAVTAACMVVCRDRFDQVGGFEPALEVAFNDIDLCLKLDAAGWRNIWTPFAELYHHESASRGLEDSLEKLARFQREIELMQERWGQRLTNDPYYSRNHTIDEEPFQLAFPPRAAWAWESPLSSTVCHRKEHP